MPILPRADALYEDLPVVNGSLEPGARRILMDTNKLADGMLDSALAPVGLASPRAVPYLIDRMEPTRNGITNGYTDGNRIGINPYIVPESSLFRKYARMLSESENPFAKYIYKQIQKPVTHLLKTIVHEKLHVGTQMRERYRSDGSSTNFINDVFEATTEYMNERLPKFLKPLSGYFASRVFVPMVEGLNEGMTYQALGMKDNGTIRAAASKEPTSYAAFTKLATESLDGMGTNSPGQFYRDYFSRGYATAKEYVGGFMNSLGRYAGQQQAACACA